VADDVGSPFEDLDPPPSRPVALVALAGGLLMVTVIAIVWGALTIAYGAEPFPWIAVVIVTVIPAMLLAIGVDMMLRAFRDSSPGYWPIAAATYVLVLVGLVALLKAAETQYAEQTARMDAACTPADIAVLRGLSPIVAHDLSTPAGDRDGNCVSSVHVPATTRDAAFNLVDAALPTSGWVSGTVDLTTQTYTRDGATVVVRLGQVDDTGITLDFMTTGSS
jgi:hypothetical protein